ncbi:MAG TPA: peptidylprolyl isomerase [Bordetella sp.]|uniref:peptidylprolyl isomerase n=1 Tax=Bordetella sp. TaxID=28081 RepID=UPI002ED100A3
METVQATRHPIEPVVDTVSVDGIVIGAEAILQEAEHHADETDPRAAASRALVVRELLRQRAQKEGLLAPQAQLDDQALDALLERELKVPSPTREDCERYYAGHPRQLRRNDIVYASHILFALVERTPLVPLRQRAEETLRRALDAPETFEALAREFSNCPSAAVGGSLGQLLRGDSVPEFERALFDDDATGILPRLVATRFGFHIVRIERRVAGQVLAFDEVQADIAAFLDQQVRQKAMRQFVQVLAAGARIEGLPPDSFGNANGPLVQ